MHKSHPKNRQERTFPKQAGIKRKAEAIQQHYSSSPTSTQALQQKNGRKSRQNQRELFLKGNTR